MSFWKDVLFIDTLTFHLENAGLYSCVLTVSLLHHYEWILYTSGNINMSKPIRKCEFKESSNKDIRNISVAQL